MKKHHNKIVFYEIPLKDVQMFDIIDIFVQELSKFPNSHERFSFVS